MKKMFNFLLVICFSLIAALAYSDDYSVPVRMPDNFVIGSYNIKWFGQLEHDLSKLAEVIQHFDVCGIIEVKDQKDLPALVTALEDLTGEAWSYSTGIKTNRPEGSYYESYAVLWRPDSVSLGDGLIGNIFDPFDTYRNDPFVVTFKKGEFDCTLMFIHTRWSDDDYGSRAGEVAGLSDIIEFMKEMSDERDIIIIGDFNYSGGSAVKKKFTEDLSYIQIDPNLKSTFKNDFSDYSSSYDHIYISELHTQEFIEGQSGIIDSTSLFYGDNSLASMELSKSELSDPLPVWASFSTSGPDDD